MSNRDTISDRWNLPKKLYITFNIERLSDILSTELIILSLEGLAKEELVSQTGQFKYSLVTIG